MKGEDSHSAAGKPYLALALGDAAGIGSEVAAKVLSDPEVRAAATFIVVGDRRQLDLGAEQAGVSMDLEAFDADRRQEDCLVDLGNLDPAAVQLGRPSRESGRAALQNFAFALRLCNSTGAQATCFTPFNKQSMRMARESYVDEIEFIKTTIGADAEGSEFNVLDEIWNARVTSHIPLSRVADSITEDRVLASIQLTHATMSGAGHDRPRLAVAALNPHAGDGGNFGTEDDDKIAPAVARAKELQISVEGPISADTVYLRAVRGEFDAVVSMYHDQGQIAMKLIGFDRGVTLIGGYPFWITTPAHGTAYDIAGKGIANPGATKRAVMMAARLAKARGGSQASVEFRQKKTAELVKSLRTAA